MSDGWTGVSLPGTGHVIPPVCPNCLAPGTVPLRYQRAGMEVFTSLWFPLSFFPFERRGLQTFHYCKACAEEARAATRRGRVLEVFSSFPVQILLVLAPIVPLWWLDEVIVRLLDIGPVGLWGLLLIPALEIPMMIYLGRWIAKASLRRAMRLHPQRTGQAAWGHAVYWAFPYLEWDGGYHAARPEWIRALVEANPGGVSDETYRQWTGRERPGVGPGRE